jgi:hypothetical protein
MNISCSVIRHFRYEKGGRMYRAVIAMAFAIAMLVGVMGSSPTRSLALQASPTPGPAAPSEVCAETETENWENRIDVEPFGVSDALVQPLDSENQDLYLVVLTIDPGTCVPYTALGNQKDVAIVLLVQQGVVEFTAEPFEGSAGGVTWGHGADDSARLDFGVTQTLNRNDWVAQNDRVWFTLRSVGSEPAVIVKAVWALPGGDGHRCGGSCR